MNSQKILVELGNISERYIEEAAPGRAARPRRGWVKWGALAACLALAVAGGALYRLEHPYPVRSAAPTAVRAEIADIPRWEDLEIHQQYSEVTWNDARYSVHGAEIPPERLGASLGTAAAAGWDAYDAEDGLRTRGAEVFAIEGLHTGCTVAVRYEAGGAYYAAVNAYYRPETLEQFVEDLDLRHTLVVGGAEYTYRKPLSGEAADVRFDAVPAEQVWALLETGLASENTWSDLDEIPDEWLGLSVSVPLLGYENISLSLRVDGSVTTNILDTGKRFQLDAAAAQAFVDYVLKECDGYELQPPESLDFIPE